MKEKQPVVIIGGAGGMGSKTAELFRDIGHEVRISDIKENFPTPQEIVTGNEIVFFSIPAREVTAVVNAISPKITHSNNIIDNSSTKTEFVDAIRNLDRQTKASICLTHPLCGPNISWKGQKVTLISINERSKKAKEIARELYESAEMKIEEITLKQEIQHMFNSQGIPHTNQRVIGIVQAERGLSFEDLKRSSTPNSELFFQGSMGRVWSQDTKLSADIIYSSLQIEENRKVMRQIIKEFEFMLNAATPELIADRFKQAEQVLFRKEDKDISETKVEIGEKTGKLIEAQKHIF